MGDLDMIVFSGDIGGTTTRMRFTEFTGSDKIRVIKNYRYHNSDYPSFDAVIDAFFAEANLNKNLVESACFGVAGPIVNETVKFTNLPWEIKTTDIKTKLKLDKVALINDFVAIGYGLERLARSDLLTLQEGKECEGGIKAYIGAGTGLGIGFMIYCQGRYEVYPTEGGHVDFAPTDEMQLELLRFLYKKHHRVSFERVLSGQGLVNIYQFVLAYKNYDEEENLKLSTLIDSKRHIDIAATIVESAIKHNDVIAKRALDIFIRIYGAAAGNLALTTLPFGGLYVVGGIVPKILSEIKTGSFLEAFTDKGRMTDLIKNIPLHVVLNTDIGLQGAAVYAKNIE